MNAARTDALFFSDDDLRMARENRGRAPIADAFAFMRRPQTDALSAAYLAAMRFRFTDDIESGNEALAAVDASDFFAGGADVKRALGWLAVIDLLRTHPDWRGHEAILLQTAGEGVAQLPRAEEDLLGRFWQGALDMAAGILLDEASRRESGAAIYREAIDRHIHPEGFLKGIVDEPGASATYEAQLSGTAALVAIAQMSGELWKYHNRAVTPITAATYTFYYYFFPEKWRWESGLSRERVRDAMRREGAFMEIVNRRESLRGGEALFAEERPMFCPYAGGLTTLTHGLARPKKRRWRLWRR